MLELFTEIAIGSLRLQNRLVRSATNARLAGRDGFMSKREIRLYSRLSAGGVGLIVTGHTYVRVDGKCSVGMLGLHTDEHIPGFAAAAQAVHRRGDAKLVVQLSYGGAQVPPDLRAGKLLAPSPRADVPEVRAMSLEEIELLALAYIEAAGRAQEAGLDGVQLHCAHGYFINQMLSPLTNRRQDRYGGDTEGRFRFLAEVIRGIRGRTGSGFPLLLKLACRDQDPEGLTLEETVRMARWAEELGCAAVEASGGMPSGMSILPAGDGAREGVFVPEAAALKAVLGIPVASVHLHRRLEAMEDVLAAGRADLISLSRPLIREPDLPVRFHSGPVRFHSGPVRFHSGPARLHSGMNPQAACISCNLCLSRRDSPTRCWAAAAEAPGGRG